MSSKRFWGLSLYEWSIWILRIKSQQDKRQQDHNLMIELERNSMALFAKAHWKGEFNGEDFYKLGYDKNDTQPTDQDKEQISETIKRLEGRVKKILKPRG